VSFPDLNVKWKSRLVFLVDVAFKHMLSLFVIAVAVMLNTFAYYYVQVLLINQLVLKGSNMKGIPQYSTTVLH
jgi:hypothetical protein